MEKIVARALLNNLLPSYYAILKVMTNKISTKDKHNNTLDDYVR